MKKAKFGKPVNVSGRSAKTQPIPKKSKPVDATAESRKLRAKGYHVRRNRSHAATPPSDEG